METHQYTSGLGSVKNCWSKTKQPRKLVKESRLGSSNPGIFKVLPEATEKMRGEGGQADSPNPGCFNCTKCHACPILKEGKEFASKNTGNSYKLSRMLLVTANL